MYHDPGDFFPDPYTNLVVLPMDRGVRPETFGPVV